MIDTATRGPLKVIPDEIAGPYIDVPVSQLADVCQLLDKNGIRYWPDGYSISLNGAPEKTTINLHRGADAAAIQAILDGAP